MSPRIRELSLAPGAPEHPLREALPQPLRSGDMDSQGFSRMHSRALDCQLEVLPGGRLELEPFTLYPNAMQAFRFDYTLSTAPLVRASIEGTGGGSRLRLENRTGEPLRIFSIEENLPPVEGDIVLVPRPISTLREHTSVEPGATALVWPSDKVIWKRDITEQDASQRSWQWSYSGQVEANLAADLVAHLAVLMGPDHSPRFGNPAPLPPEVELIDADTRSACVHRPRQVFVLTRTPVFPAPLDTVSRNALTVLVFELPTAE